MQAIWLLDDANASWALALERGGPRRRGWPGDPPAARTGPSWGCRTTGARWCPCCP